MKIVELEEELEHDVESVWAIFADVTRSDWVPAVDSIVEQDGIRSFTMEGIGEVQERILKIDHANFCLQYSAIKTPRPLEHHLATIQLSASEKGCHFLWSTEIAPDEFSPAIENGMAVSLEGLKRVLSNQTD